MAPARADALPNASANSSLTAVPTLSALGNASADLSPALVLENLSVSPASAYANQPLALYMTLSNSGSAASNSINVSIFITGPKSFNITEPVPALSPGQSEDLALHLGNATESTGSYAVTAYATDGSSAEPVQEVIAYTVYAPTNALALAPGEALPASPVEYPAANAQVQIIASQIPYLSSVVPGAALSSYVTLTNTDGVLEGAKLSVPAAYSGMLTVRPNSVIIQPYQTVPVKITFGANATVAPGTYVIPLNANVTAKTVATNVSNQYTYFLVYQVASLTGNAMVLSTPAFSQNDTTVTLRITAPPDRNIYNGTLMTVLSSSIISNLSQIQATGASVRMVNGKPTIQWSSLSVPAGGTANVSYALSRPGGLYLLTNMPSLLVIPSQATGTIRIVSSSAPTLYNNSRIQVTVSAIYTGTSSQQVSFSLQPEGYVTVISPLQIVNASPNQLIERTFTVESGSYTGTALLKLDISADGASVSSTIPLVILRNSAPVKQPSLLSAIKYFLLAAFVIMIFISATEYYLIKVRPVGHSKYSRKREKELMEVKAEIKEEEREEEKEESPHSAARKPRGLRAKAARRARARRRSEPSARRSRPSARKRPSVSRPRPSGGRAGPENEEG